ncbi:YitT family protein [Leptotrichia sp. OH3620_COT-345]|uniref:YczE/YyaS/YitT family protein n=1 Tax=Leptotrichia sp. OH3620_COT-345 TaxID=2491048 RepID=UPI001F15978B|nr:hypothetical protein [Leptotrichia sp. OH3620_COT-345]
MHNKERGKVVGNKQNIIKEIKIYIIIVIFLILTGIGVSLIVKIGIGLGPWDAVALTFSYLTGLKIGTVGMIFNLLCILGQFIIEGKKFKKISFLQILVLLLIGNVVNYFIYTVFKNLYFNNYFIKFMFILIGIIFVSFSVSAILVLGKPTFPLESFCSAVHKKTKISYSKFRQWVDMGIIAIITVTTLLFSLPWSLREGTVLFAILFGPFLGIFMPKIEQIFEKWGLIDGKSEIEKEIEGIA